MVSIILDTTVLRNDPARKKEAFRTLKRLVDSENITVYLPELVIREFLSQESEQHEKSITSITSEIKKLQKKPISSTDNESLAQVLGNFINLQTNLDDFSQSQIQSWINENEVQIIPFAGVNVTNLISDYFQGKHPFRSKKSREDFPDAMIWQAVLEVQKKEKEVYFITGDKRVRDGANGFKGVISLESLDEFIKLDEVQELVVEANKEVNIRRLIELIKENESIVGQIIKNALPDLTTSLAGKTIESAYLPDDNGEATIEGVYQPSEIYLASEDIEYYGDGVFVTSIDAIVNSDLTYFIYKADYYCLDDERASSIFIGDWSDHYFSAGEMLPIKVRLNISISIESELLELEEISDEKLLSSLDQSFVDVDSVDTISLYLDSND